MKHWDVLGHPAAGGKTSIDRGEERSTADVCKARRLREMQRAPCGSALAVAVAAGLGQGEKGDPAKKSKVGGFSERCAGSP